MYTFLLLVPLVAAGIVFAIYENAFSDSNDMILATLILLFGATIVAYQILRSISLSKGFSLDTMKMYVLLTVAPIIGALSAAGAITSESAVALFGAIIGYAIGENKRQPDTESS